MIWQLMSNANYHSATRGIFEQTSTSTAHFPDMEIQHRHSHAMIARCLTCVESDSLSDCVIHKRNHPSFWINRMNGRIVHLWRLLLPLDSSIHRMHAFNLPRYYAIVVARYNMCGGFVGGMISILQIID